MSSRQFVDFSFAKRIDNRQPFDFDGKSPGKPKKVTFLAEFDFFVFNLDFNYFRNSLKALTASQMSEVGHSAKIAEQRNGRRPKYFISDPIEYARKDVIAEHDGNRSK